MTAASSDRGLEVSGTRYAELASALVKEIVGGGHVVGTRSGAAFLCLQMTTALEAVVNVRG
jgi:hypothetical protein